MKKGLLIFLIAISPAWADDQRNVYDVFRELAKPVAGAIVDEQTTAFIKRDMANLLYPVDMASFARPKMDQKFRDAIMMLQKQMGAPVTGILTLDQFDRLEQAALDIKDRFIGMEGIKVVDMAADGSAASASGTLVGVAGKDVAHKINHTRIMCVRAEGTCEVSQASFDPNTSFLYLDWPEPPYVVKAWTSHTIVAVSEGPCGIEASLTIDAVAKTATLSSSGSCIDNTPSTFSFVDGFPIAWKIYQDRVNAARALVYEPARRLVGPPVQDASPAQK